MASFLNRAYEVANLAVEAPEVTSVSAINGKVTVTLAKAVEEVSVEDFKVSQAINALVATEVTPSKAVLAEDGVTVTLTVKEVAQTEAKQAVVYTVNEVAAKGFVVEAVAPEVVSVSAINLKQVEVKFSKTVDKATAEDEVNYKINAAAVAAGTTAVLSEDKKSVILTLPASVNNTSFDLNVKNVLTEDKKSTVAEFTGVVSVKDITAPIVSKTEFAANGDLEITFSESLSAVNPIVRVAGNPVTITPVVAGNTKVVVPAANLSVAAGSTSTVYVAGAKDTVGNEMNIFNGSVTKVADVTLPTIVSLQQLGHNQVRVVLSEVLGGTTSELADGELKFLKGAGLNVTPSTVSKNTTVDATGKTYDVTFATADIYGSPEADTATVSLLLAKDAVKDVAGNGISEYTQSFTFSADKTGPQLVSSKVAANKQTLEFTFNEEFLADAADPLVNNIDETKIIVTGAAWRKRYNVGKCVTTVAKGTGEDAKVLVLDFCCRCYLQSLTEHTLYNYKQAL